jgi:hypothetical protein
MRFDTVSYDLDLAEDERCFYHYALAKSHRPMCLGVSDRALFVARERFLKVKAYTMHRIPLTDVKEVILSRDRSARDLVKGGLMLLFGALGMIAMGIGYLSAPDIKVPPLGVAGALGFTVSGIALLIDGRWRLALTIKTSEKDWRWRPHVFDKRVEVRNLREGFLDACRYVGVPTRRLDLVNEAEIKAFWQWFEPRASNRSLDCSALQSRLHKLCDRIDIVIKENERRGFRELVFTANYAQDAFPIVDELVFAAPKLQGWQITAFMPPRSVGATYIFEGIEYPLKDIFFIPYTNGFNFAIEIYADLGSMPTEMIWALFRDILGEYESVCGVKYIDIFDLAHLDDDTEVHQISELFETVENFHHFEIN